MLAITSEGLQSSNRRHVLTLCACALFNLIQFPPGSIPANVNTKMYSAAFALACLFTLQLPSERFSLPLGADDSTLFLPSRVKRQGNTTACLKDFDKLQRSDQECLSLIEDLSTTSNVQKFCSGDCGAKMKPIFTDLVEDCANSVCVRIYV